MFEFLKKKNTDPKRALLEALGSYTLPSFSKVDLEIMRRIREPDASSSDIAEVLELDPALTVRLMALANSAAFTPRHEVRSVSMAISLVGLSQLESLVLSATLKKRVPTFQLSGLNSELFWRTSALRGALARSLSKRLCPARAGECFSAGFLQDLAIPFLATCRGQAYEPFLEAWHEGGRALMDFERESFGWDHGEVATWIAHEWDVPVSLASAIGGHHTPENDLYDCPIPVALVANLSDTEASLEEFRQTLEAYVPVDQIDDLVCDAQKSVSEFSRFFT